VGLAEACVALEEKQPAGWVGDSPARKLDGPLDSHFGGAVKERDVQSRGIGGA